MSSAAQFLSWALAAGAAGIFTVQAMRASITAGIIQKARRLKGKDGTSRMGRFGKKVEDHFNDRWEVWYPSRHAWLIAGAVLLGLSYLIDLALLIAGR